MTSTAVDIEFVDNPAIRERMSSYVCVTVNTDKVLQSWRASLYSFEWVRPDGQIKSLAELPEKEQAKRQDVMNKLQAGAPLEKPVLGIGLLENIEIGIGRHVFLTAAAHGIKHIPVHIPASHQEDFTPFLSKPGHSESGNALFYILIAVALLAALSYAVTFGSRATVNNLDRDRINLLSSEILEYANIIANGVSQLRLRGYRPDNISFESPQTAANDYIGINCTTNDHECKVFHPSGGGLVWKFVPEQALESAHDGSTDYGWWSISGYYDIDEIGTNCADETCKDLVAYANYLRRDVCIALNDLLNVTNPGGEPPKASGGLDPMNEHFHGTFSSLSGTVEGDSPADKQALAGRNAACVAHITPSDPTYMLYQVLIPR